MSSLSYIFCNSLFYHKGKKNSNVVYGINCGIVIKKIKSGGKQMADKTSRDYVICLCRGITRGTVEDAIRENKITDLKVLCETTNAGTKCGGCREDLENLINEIAGN